MNSSWVYLVRHPIDFYMPHLKKKNTGHNTLCRHAGEIILAYTGWETGGWTDVTTNMLLNLHRWGFGHWLLFTAKEQDCDNFSAILAGAYCLPCAWTPDILRYALVIWMAGCHIYMTSMYVYIHTPFKGYMDLSEIARRRANLTCQKN